MKIGLVCPYNIALGGAVQEIVRESAAELKRRGHDVVIITPRPQQGEQYSGEHRIVYLGRAMDSKSPFGTVAQISISRNSKEISDMFAEEKFDVLHMHEPWVPVLNGQILPWADCPVIATFHAKLPDNNTAKALTAFGRPYTVPPLKYLDTLVAVSEPAAEHVRLLTDRPVQIIPNAVNITEFTNGNETRRRKEDEGAKIILFVGRLEERKGVKYLIKAFHRLNQAYPDARLVVAGDGVDRAKLEAMVERGNIQNVTFLGYISDSEKKYLMRIADLFVAPAVYGESFGIVLIEALASGQVLVVGNNEGYRCVMKELGQVSVVDPKDIEAFAERMELLLTDEKLRRIYRNWAKKYIGQFDYRKVTDEYIKIYDKLVALNREHPRLPSKHHYRKSGKQHDPVA